jgi:hypothetical protein
LPVSFGIKKQGSLLLDLLCFLREEGLRLAALKPSSFKERTRIAHRRPKISIFIVITLFFFLSFFLLYFTIVVLSLSSLESTIVLPFLVSCCHIRDPGSQHHYMKINPWLMGIN